MAVTLSSPRPNGVPNPFGPPYAREIVFWRLVGHALLLGGIMGLISLGFMNVIEKIPELWLGHSYPEERYDFVQGDWFWIFIMAVAGIFVGILRYCFNMHDDLDGFLDEIKHQYVDVSHAPQALIVSLISLAGITNLSRFIFVVTV